MHVILTVARDTVLGGGNALAFARLVARMTSDGPVGAGQFEARIAGMIKDPAIPTVGCMALSTSAADATLMMLVGVAGLASLWRLPVCLGAVTRSAADR